ncbi:unnamed protein product, partial [Symbiodinium necroappetens]
SGRLWSRGLQISDRGSEGEVLVQPARSSVGPFQFSWRISTLSASATKLFQLCLCRNPSEAVLALFYSLEMPLMRGHRSRAKHRQAGICQSSGSDLALEAPGGRSHEGDDDQADSAVHGAARAPQHNHRRGTRILCNR